MDHVAFLAVPCKLLFGLMCASRDSATVLCVFRYVSTRAVRARKSPNVQDIRRVRYSREPNAQGCRRGVESQIPVCGMGIAGVGWLNVAWELRSARPSDLGPL